MNKPRADALVFFGATGDLAYKKIFPALQAMARRGRLDVPVIGVAKSGWTLEQLVERARASVREYGTEDAEAFTTLASRLQYVDGDYADPNTFAQLRRELEGRTRPAHYLAIPPDLFPTVIQGLRDANCTTHARVIVEKPFGHDSRVGPGPEPDPAQRLRRRLHLPHRPLPRQGSRSEPALLPVRELVPGTALEPELRGERANHAG